MRRETGIVDVTDFLREKLKWHECVQVDPALTNLAKTIASLLLHDFDFRQGCEAYRSQLGLAERAKCGQRAVQKGLSQLAHAGYIEIIAARGRGHTNHYRFLPIKNTNVGSPQTPEKANVGSPQDPQKANVGSQKGERRFAQPLLESPISPLPPSKAADAVLAHEGERTAFAPSADGTPLPLEVIAALTSSVSAGVDFRKWLIEGSWDPNGRRIITWSRRGCEEMRAILRHAGVELVHGVIARIDFKAERAR